MSRVRVFPSPGGFSFPWRAGKRKRACSYGQLTPTGFGLGGGGSSPVMCVGCVIVSIVCFFG